MTINELINYLENYKTRNHLDGNQELVPLFSNGAIYDFDLNPAYEDGEITTRYVFIS